MFQEEVVHKGGSPFSEEKGRRQWIEGLVRVGLRRKEGGGCDQDVKCTKYKLLEKKEIELCFSICVNKSCHINIFHPATMDFSRLLVIK